MRTPHYLEHVLYRSDKLVVRNCKIVAMGYPISSAHDRLIEIASIWNNLVWIKRQNVADVFNR